ncbi:SDR family oxidoreductase [Solirubrobacter phytolaccae]|uniref:SDR family oxidoreductase n=1 Tax=Solirubrobacter phytolaccae TaxID=1404360 RepID=A0A9X3S6S5_9ACTN|nr:NAD(P)H-binding protein [Solirubrobacter phytolaccae]MDA0179463.1 SDR family oxidoreductase [Solirubrobacter phytolaccae]
MIAVTTPTGNVGRHVTAMLIRAGVRPRVLVRDPTKLGDLGGLVDAVETDLSDADAVAHATEGVDAMNERQVDALMGMSTGLREGFTPEQPRDATTTTPTTLRAFVADHIRPRHGG